MSKGVRRLLIIVIVVAAVLVAADFGVAAAAEYQISKKMRTELNLTSDPSVNIKGFPFITQAIGGDYQDISVSAQGVPVGSTLRDLEVDADLKNVRIPFSNVLSGNFSALTVDEVDGQVQIKASDLGRLIGVPDLTINPESLDFIQGFGVDEKNQALQQQQKANGNNTTPMYTQAGIDLSGSINIAGVQTTVDAYGLISIVGTDIVIKPTKVQLSNSSITGPIPNAIEQPILKQLTYTFHRNSLPLPFAVTPVGVQVQGGNGGALIVQGVAKNVSISGSANSQ
ncbi:MAG TPA: DUF2993 domain-containing protein [Pseudonocardiaceae bacterium]